MSVQAAKKKRVERYFLERARRTGRQIPSGDTVEWESPDFLIRRDSGLIGVEVSQLFQPAPLNAPKPRAVESFQDAVMRAAAEIYQKSGSRPVDVLAYWDQNRPQRGCEQAADALVDFVRSHYGDREDNIENYYRPEPPQRFAVIRIASPLDGRTNIWQAGHAGQVMSLDEQFLSGEIARKNKKVSAYRQKADCVWLLFVASLFPLPASFTVRGQLENWAFKFDFDKMLLFSEEDNRVFELSRAGLPQSQDSECR